MSSEPSTTTTNPRPSVHVVPATSVVGPGADVTSPSDQVGAESTAPSSVSDVAVAGDATLLSSGSLEQLSSRSLVLSEGSQDDSTFHTLRPSVSMDPDTLLVEAAMASLDPIIESHEGHSFVEPHVSPVCRQSSISNAHSNYGSSGDYDGSYDEVHEAPQYEQLEAEHADTSSLDDGSSEAHDDFHGHKDMCHPQVHDQKWTPRPSTIDDIPSGFSILTFPSEPPPVITTPPGKAAAMDCWEYDTEQQQQQAVVEPSSPPDSLHDRVSINNLTLPAPLVHGVMTRSPEPSPPPPPTSSTTPKSKSRFSLLKAFERNHGPSKPMGLVTLTPQTILYHMDVGSAPSGSVTLTNLTSSVVVYKVKSAHPLRYKVKPTQGFLEPKGHCVVTIDLHPAAYNDLLCLSNMELGDIRDCLLVEAATSPTSRSSKALRNAKTHGELLGLMRTLWDEVNKKDVNVSRLFCEYAFDDSAYQSFVATLDGPVVVDGPVSPAVDEPRTPPAIIKKGNGFGWPRSKTPTNKVLRNAL
ncbi:hypothetical protein DYB25_013117 [Aphanomyces astaci]|uniref:MSP domain-containing protein n=2 Tax=Aphanomyces astaci TaxID=112090 RepID=A0A397BCD3_APHAT|nr:hypothetical protein DYB25_013117 [Aphanomyces astaci]